MSVHSLRRKRLEDEIEIHRPSAERPVKPLTAHRRVIDHRHPVVDAPHEPVRSRRDDRESVKLGSRISVYPTVPQAREGERLAALEIKPHRHLAVAFSPPLIESISRNQAASR